MSDLTPEELNRRIENASDARAQVAFLIEKGASEFVISLATVFSVAGILDQIPPSWIIFAALQHTEMYIGEIDRDQWIKIYDQAREIREVMKNNPEILDNIKTRQEEALSQAESKKSALDIALEEELGLNFGE